MTSSGLARSAAYLLIVLGVVLLSAITYAPQILGVGDDAGLVVMHTLRGLGLLLFLGAGYLFVQARKQE